MPINDLPKSLVDSVIDVVTKSAQNEEKLLEKIIKEGLARFGVSDASALSENDVKALYAWTQIRLNEAMCACGGEIEEDDMPGDAPFHKDGDEEGEKKKEIDEDDDGDERDEIKEAIALGPDEIATNGAVGVGDATLALPIHADVIHDTDPHSGITQYRLLLQYATNEGTRIYPPVSLPGAASLADLRTLVEGLPEFNEAVDSALIVASTLSPSQVQESVRTPTQLKQEIDVLLNRKKEIQNQLKKLKPDQAEHHRLSNQLLDLDDEISMLKNEPNYPGI